MTRQLADLHTGRERQLERELEAAREALRKAQKGCGNYLWLGNNIRNFEAPEFKKLFEAGMDDARRGYDMAEAVLKERE